MGRPKGSGKKAPVQTDDILTKALSEIEKDFGKGSIVRLGDHAKRPDIKTVSTGSFYLDLALGIGGLPMGRIVEIYGPESSGKTTMMLQTIAQAQIQYPDKICAVIDVEHALDLKYAESLGVDVDNLYLSQPDYGEQALQIADKLIKTNKFSVIAVDSVAALIPKKELDGEVGDSSLGLHARMMSQACRKLVGVVSQSDCILFFSNQLREKIGVMFGSPETTTGGNALKFYASVRLDIRKRTAIKDGDEVLGNLTWVKVVKNKVAAPLKEVEFDIMYGKGSNYEKEIINAAIDANIINKSGSWFSYGESKIGQGMESVISLLADNPDLMEEIEGRVKNFYYGTAEVLTPITITP